MLTKPLGALLGVALGVATLATPLAAQESLRLAENQWYLSPMGSFVMGEAHHLDYTGGGLHLGAGRAITPNWLMELNFVGNSLDRNGNNEDQLGVGVDFLRPFAGSARIQPYLLLGAGYLKTNIQEGSMNGVPNPAVKDPTNMMSSLGLGIMTRMGDRNIRLRAEVRGRVDYRQNNRNDILVSVGFVIPQKLAAAAVVDSTIDSDRDGVPNVDDDCPGTPLNSTVDARGCRNDSDGDGVPDDRDKCPGTPRGVTVGPDGCPLDSDGDGVLDADDECPNTPAGAPVDRRGCEIKGEYELPGVTFELSSAKLVPESTGKLDQAVEALKKYPDLRVEVGGHTDSTGPAELNRRLSQERAESVRQYLIDAGIAADRVTARGYGPSEPVGDNTTPEGQQANRRVALKVLP